MRLRADLLWQGCLWAEEGRKPVAERMIADP
jgi:hypothetical protein